MTSLWHTNIFWATNKIRAKRGIWLVAEMTSLCGQNFSWTHRQNPSEARIWLVKRLTLRHRFFTGLFKKSESYFRKITWHFLRKCDWFRKSCFHSYGKNNELFWTGHFVSSIWTVYSITWKNWSKTARTAKIVHRRTNNS